MDLFSIQSMLNSLYVPPFCSSSSSSPSNVSSASQNPQHAHPSGLSAFEFYLHHQHLHRQCLPSSTSNFRNAFASSDVPCAGTEHHQFDPELLQKVVHHLGALVQHNQQPFVTTSDTQGTASSPLSALLLLLQKLRSLPNGQSSVPSDPTSILPLCSPPDFCPLLPADSANANKMTATVSSSNQRSSTFEHQKTPPATSCDFISVSSGSSCSSSFESSLGESKTFSVGGTRNASGVATAHRLSYPREFKLLVLKSFWANGQNKYRTCKEFQITKSMLNGWLQKADRIRRSRPGSLKSGRSGRRPQFPKVEQQLFEMVQHHLSLGERASNKWIRKMARKLTATAESNRGEKEEEDGGGGRGTGEDGGGGMCQFSERWLNNFKRRYGIQTVEGTVAASADEADGDEARRAEALFVGAISPPHAPLSPRSPTDELWQDEEQWRSIAWEICATNDRLPIQAFYDRFPKVLQQTGAGAGRRERNGAKSAH